MRVRFRVNLGSKDAATIGVDHEKCCAGEEVTVGKAAGQWLCDRGIATDATPPPPEKKLEAVPPETTTESPVDLKTSAKSETKTSKKR